MQSVLDAIAGLPPAGIYAVIGLLAAVENIFPPVPADLAIALGAFLAARGVVSVWGVYGVAVAANVLGAAAVFEIARHYGKRFLQSRAGQRLVSEKAQEKIGALYSRYHLWGILVSRLLPVYRSIVPPFAAAMGLPARKALPPVAIATAAYYAVLSAIAYELGQNWDAVRHLVARIGVGLGAGALALTILIVWAWVRHHRNEAPDEHD